MSRATRDGRRLWAVGCGSEAGERALCRVSSLESRVPILLLLLLLFSGAFSAHAATPVARSVDSVALTVDDTDRARQFYEGVLGFKFVSTDEVAGDEYEHLYGLFGLRLKRTRLKLGEESIELLEFLAPRGRPMPADSRSNDRWFQHIAIIVSDMDAAYATLRAHHVAHASSGPQLLPAWNPNAGGISAFYFRDPDDNVLEILHFPAGKGDAKWQRKDALFLGVDHTAIVVADTDASLKYYRDVLGFKVAGESENYGTEQEHLNNVFGARLRITALRAGSGPGIELLEYLAPRTGRPMPTDTQASDAWYWQVNLRADVPAADRALRASHAMYVSPGVVSLANHSTGLTVRDPDGHAQQLSDGSP
jgi:catechol 2,3-dioxygenase-like lactoylglutathione lyase family enzyme